MRIPVICSGYDWVTTIAKIYTSCTFHLRPQLRTEVLKKQHNVLPLARVSWYGEARLLKDLVKGDVSDVRLKALPCPDNFLLMISGGVRDSSGEGKGIDGRTAGDACLPVSSFALKNVTMGLHLTNPPVNDTSRRLRNASRIKIPEVSEQDIFGHEALEVASALLRAPLCCWMPVSSRMASWERSLLSPPWPPRPVTPTMTGTAAGNIRIAFNDHSKSSRRLEVKVNNKRVELSRSGKEEKSGVWTHRWTLRNEIHFFPNDTVTLQVMNDKRRRWFSTRSGKIEEIELLYEDIAKQIRELDVVTLRYQTCSITLEVTVGGIADTNALVSVEDLDGLLPERIEELMSSIDSFSENIKEIRSVLEGIPLTDDAWKIFEDTIKTLGKAHPLAKAVLTALSIPYNFLKNEREFKENVKDLANVMQFTCKCLVDVRYHTKVTSAKETFISIMRILQNAAVYIDDYTWKGKFDQLFAAQFPTKLEKYAEDLLTLKNDFQMAMVMQVARDADKVVSMSTDDFLQKRLGPVGAEELRLVDSCLEGTRVNILREVRSWLQDDESKNILWVVGAPGAGKSTIAATIAKKPADRVPFCAKFFCKRDVEGLRDPHRIWRTLAYQLAGKHDGVKATLMRVLEEKKCNPQDFSILDQFEELIKGPLETDLEETRFRTRKVPYPLVIIDALDECYTADSRDWKALLESLLGWTRLCGSFKLVVTSRDFLDIRETLGDVSHRVDLTTGENVSDESKTDISTFFTQKFAEMSKEHAILRSRSDWPGSQQLQEMTNYAAGLFIWADMVVKYVGHRTSGSNPEQRLESVLSDIRIKPGNHEGESRSMEGSNQVDRLYARIVFEAFRQSEPRERKVGKQILATIVLAIRPLRKDDLVELFTAETSNSRDVLARIESTLRELSPIIPVVDVNDDLRVCHKTVSDFLLSHERSAAAMKYVVHNWPRGKSIDHVINPLSFVIDGEGENWNLALACVQLLRRYFAKEIDSLAGGFEQSSNSLDYACHHWFEHLEHSVTRRMPVMGPLANAMATAFGCMDQHRGQLMSLSGETKGVVKRLRDAAEFVCQYMNNAQLSIDSPQELVQCTKLLDIARGHFQIALVVHLARDVDSSALDKIAASDNFLRKRLQPSDQTVLDNKCLEGTRISVISEAKNWLEESDGPNILWIYGAPGSGKSAIATTLVDEFRNIQLCAKVFAKRDFADRRDPMLIWRTLAYDLANLHVGLKGSIMENLYHRRHRSENTTEDQLQFRDLVMDALRQQRYLPVVAVIDALDECFTDDHGKWTTLLKTLTDCHDSPRSFKLVVTSRDLPDIRRALEGVSHPIFLATGADASQEEHYDIQNFLRSKIADILSVQLSEESLEELTGYAGGSFIWAKMVVGLLETVDPVAPQKEFLHNVRGVGDIDILYGLLLLAALRPLDERRRELTRSFLAALVLARNPLRKSDLVDLADSNHYSLDERRRLVNTMVVNLRSIISVDDEDFLRIPHKSFSDFCLNRDRSLEAMKVLLQSDKDVYSYLVDPEKDSAKLCIACLRLMDNSLKFNAYGIKTSRALHDTSVSELLSESIPSSLLYACRFWAEHLKPCVHGDQQFRALAEPLLRTLLHKNLLYWLEILSFVQAMSSAATSLEVVVNVLEGYGSELAEVARDGAFFVRMFEVPIAAAVPHIYLSALPFCPSDSCVARIYGPQYPNLLSVVSGRRMKWDVASTTSVVYGVTFLPNRGKLISGLGDGSVRMWDARTGDALSKLSTETTLTYPVLSVAVSPDGSQIASGYYEGALRIWDSNTGACPLGSIKAHSDDGSVWSVAYSPDGSRIVTSSGDNIVRVRNASTGDFCLGPLTGHTGDVMSTAYSPDGTLIASGSWDNTIRIWDAHTGESRLELLTGHTDGVRCVAFSPNGRYLASGSFDGTIRLWDASQRFSQIVAIPVGSGILSLSFSPDSSCLVSGSEDGALRFWNVSSGGCERIGVPIYGHVREADGLRRFINGVSSVAFAPDGLSVASGGVDSSIKLWTIPTTSTLNLSTGIVEEKHPQNATHESLDAHGHLVLSDESFIDDDGWMHASRREGAGVLFWVPRENRGGVWWPRNTLVIHETVTKFDFSRFVHDENWTECRASESESDDVVG